MPDAVGQQRTGADGSPYLIGRGGSAFPPAATSTNPFLTPYDLAQSNDPSVVVGTLGVMLLLHPRREGVLVESDVTFEHFDSGSQTPEHGYSEHVTGSLLADGGFDVQCSTAVTIGDASTVYESRLSFDGRALACVGDDAENGNVFPVAYARFADVFPALCLSVAPLYWWNYDVFEIPAFSGVLYAEETPAGSNRIFCRRSYPAAEGGCVSDEYEIDTAGPVPHPIASRAFDQLGRRREETLFSNYQAISAGVWRPFKVKKTEYLDGVATGRRIVTTLTIGSASVLSAQQVENLPAPYSETQVWFTWL